MNWRNVRRLVAVNLKAYRAVRGARFRRFREQRFWLYAPYAVMCVLGLLVGWFIGSSLSGIADATLKANLASAAKNLLAALPTFTLVYGLVFTQMSQIQRVGVKITVQPLYWLPVSWEEHTVSSVIANMVGAPLAIAVFTCSSIFFPASALGLTEAAVLTVTALILSLFMSSITTEAFKTVQLRVYGAITRAAGRAAVWLRLVGSILFLIAFYAVYFSFSMGASAVNLIGAVADWQRMLWFIPYLWPATMVSAFAEGFQVEAMVFAAASLIFVYVLFTAAVRLNVRFGLYEAPSLRISTGAYAPKTGLLMRLGFTHVEAALLRKDFKAFTRRYELTFIFVMPIIAAVMPMLSLIRGEAAPTLFSGFLTVYLTIFPAALTAVTLGSTIFGCEGERVRQLYALPIPLKSLVKAKYAFTLAFSFAVTAICYAIACAAASPSLKAAILSVAEALLLTTALSIVSLNFGIRGADFRELPRPRMIRPLWSMINAAVCFAVGLAIIAPMIPIGIGRIIPADAQTAIAWLRLPDYYPFLALIISGLVAAAATVIFYRLALKGAERLFQSIEY